MRWPAFFKIVLKIVRRPAYGKCLACGRLNWLGYLLDFAVPDIIAKHVGF